LSITGKVAETPSGNPAGRGPAGPAEYPALSIERPFNDPFRVAFYALHMLIITMSFCKRRIIAFLFSVYFLLNVLSPICYTEDGPSENNATGYQTNLSTKSIRVIWELILSKHLTHKDAESSRPNVQLLIRKTRTLVSSNNIVELIPSESAEFDCNGITYSRNSHASSDQRTKPEYRTGLYHSVSGLSPPSFS
jgi:hypothetical protein